MTTSERGRERKYSNFFLCCHPSACDRGPLVELLFANTSTRHQNNASRILFALSIVHGPGILTCFRCCFVQFSLLSSSFCSPSAGGSCVTIFTSHQEEVQCPLALTCTPPCMLSVTSLCLPQSFPFSLFSLACSTAFHLSSPRVKIIYLAPFAPFCRSSSEELK